MKKIVVSLVLITSLIISFYVRYAIKQKGHPKIETEEKIYEGVQIAKGVYKLGIGSIEINPFQRNYALIWIYKQGSNEKVNGTKIFEGEKIGDSDYKIVSIGIDFKGKFIIISD